MRVLVTGGTGYVGSHVAVALSEAGHEIVLLDNLCHSSSRVVDRINSLVDRNVEFVEADVRDRDHLGAVFSSGIDAVVHCAALKSVEESIISPVGYYETNISGTLNLLSAMKVSGVKKMVFSSSATIYHPDAPMPVDEEAPIGPINPYGRTKLMIEEIMADVARSDDNWSLISLRYFNPVGAHPSARLGEDPSTSPTNLMPRVLDVALGAADAVQIFGDDWPTSDGTCTRDYIHVCDLADGHVAAIQRLSQLQGHHAINLGTGTSYSVREVIRAVSAASGRPVPFVVGPRRQGDAAVSCADASLAKALLGWSASRDIDAMCLDAWAWRSSNPDGFG